MRLSAANRRTYPKLYRYIRTQIPRLRNVRAIIRGLKTYGNLTEVEVRAALAWNSGPVVVVTSLSAGQCGVPVANGCFSSARPNELQIARFRVLQLENSNASRYDRTSSGRQILIIGTTLLHELCHFGNRKHGKVYTGGEAGVDFETALYGRNTG